MKQGGKRALSVLLALVMAFSLVPVAVQAEEIVSVEDTYTAGEVASESLNTEEEIAEEEIAEEEIAQEAGEIQSEGTAETLATVEETAADTATESLMQVAVADGDTLSGGETITAGGTYQLAAGATGQITISTTEQVIIVGNGVDIDENGTVTSTANTVCFLGSGITELNLTLRDVCIGTNQGNTLDMEESGSTIRLTIEGTCVIDKDSGYNLYASIHVPVGDTFYLLGGGTGYFYKSSQGSLIGGDSGEMNGTIIFDMTGEDGTQGSAFMKGTKQGAMIGAGANSKGSDTPGSITFKSGIYNLITNSRAACIGGSAGSGGASEGTKVYFEGGTININADYSGASVGGGGYDVGNDSSGGTAYFGNASVRIYTDKNAADNVTTPEYYNGLALTEGANNISMTALRKDLSGNDVYLCIVDTAGIEPDANGNYTVYIDGDEWYCGGLHEYGFVQEALDKGDQLSITSTPSNWVKNGETNLYFYLTGEDHRININNVQEYDVTFQASAVDTIDECNGGAFVISHGSVDEWTTTEDEHWHVCKVDGCEDTTHLYNKAAHTAAAEKVNVKAATCTEDGYSGDTVCEICGMVMETGAAIPAAHTPGEEKADVKAATCTEDGYTGDTVCSVCGEVTEAGEVTKATGHTYELQNQKDATTTEDGYTGDMVCTTCGDTVVGKVIKLVGEQVTYYTITYDANGGTNAPDKATWKVGKAATIATAKPSRDGYTFLGWSTDKKATTAEYQAGAGYAGEEDITLYAIWQEETTMVYRLYQAANGEHLYTTDVEEVHQLTANHGWKYEGSAWTAPTSGTAVYRLYNSGLGSHVYTTDTNEVETLTTKYGWQKDFGGQPLFYSGGDVSVYRLYNEGLKGMHHWTTDANEYNTLPSHNWEQEGLAFYAKAKGDPNLAMP